MNNPIVNETCKWLVKDRVVRVLLVVVAIFTVLTATYIRWASEIFALNSVLGLAIETNDVFSLFQHIVGHFYVVFVHFWMCGVYSALDA